MEQNKVIGISAVVIIAVLGVWYFTSSSPVAESPLVATSTTETAKTTGIPGATNTFRSIFTQTGNHECTYQQVETSGTSSNVIHIADGKMHAEFRTTSSGNTVASIMVYDGGYLYSWKEGATVGRKTSIKSLSDLPEVIPQDLTSGAILGGSTDNVSWDCHSWNKDAKVLAVPTYVTFTAK